MKRLVTIIAVLLFGAAKLSAAASTVDSLKQRLAITSDSLKGPIYTQLATRYLRFDTLVDEDRKLVFQEHALTYTLLALHYYSKYNDSTGLRISFNTLATVYLAQKKYTQAKWFILQSNTLSRAKNDVPNIISSLVVLANIKMDIKDYDLALGDLTDAQKLSVTHRLARTESVVQQNLAMLYTRMEDYDKAAIAIKRHNLIDDSIRRSEQAALVAKIKAEDSLNSKKKFFTASNWAPYMGPSFAKTASL
jgi:tetratricopeptide (TPR) repeat protein